MPLDEVKKLKLLGSSKTVAEAITDTVGKLGENIQLRRAIQLAVQPGRGVVSGYVHRVQKTSRLLVQQVQLLNELQWSDSWTNGFSGGLGISRRCCSTQRIWK
jgi:translation elongation factor EF-Ts